MSNSQWHEDQAIGEAAIHRLRKRDDLAAEVVEAARAVVAAWDERDREAERPKESQSSAPWVRYLGAQLRLRQAVQKLEAL